MKIKKIASLALALTLVMACAVGGTVAKYTSNKTATSAPGQIAKWEFNVNDKDIATENFTINPFGEIVDGSGIVVDANVKDNLMAPGTKGSFKIVLDNVSDVTADYAVEFTAAPDGVPLLFSLTEADGYDADITLLDINSAEDDADDYDALAKNGGTKTITVYWKWEFGGDDTQLGVDAAAGNPAEPTVTVKVTATQVD